VTKEKKFDDIDDQVISALDRTFHNSNFECRAINNNVTEPPK
jgi:hypothetical protein